MMDRQLKQRVVGAGLLVALGVIFIPIFLDNGGVESPVPPSMNIPPAPTEDVSQRAPALGDDAIAEMESQADEDVELPPSRVQSGEGSSAEPAPEATPSVSGEAPLAVETLEDGAVPAPPAEPGVVLDEAPRMQPPAPRPVSEPAPMAPATPEIKAKAEPKLKPAEVRPVAKPAESKPAAKAPEAKPVAKAAEVKPVAKPPEAKPVAKPVEPKVAAKTTAKTENKPEAPAAAKPAEAKTTDAHAPATAKPGAPLIGGWTVQLGSFSSDLNAKKLVDKLKAAGYKAYTEPRLEQGATVFKVRVGPTPGKAEAERLRQRIEGQFDARGMLVPSR